MNKRFIPNAKKKIINTSQIEGERKNVTLLFANISGLTTLSEKLPPPDFKDIIGNLLKILKEIVNRYEGTIDNFIGNCIMILFGVSIKHEDDPERAVYAALDIMSKLGRFNEEQGTNLSIHTGISSGAVVVCRDSSGSSKDYTVMGDTVDYAERLMLMAKEEVLVSESVYKSTVNLFEMNRLKPVGLKGETAGIIPYRVVGIREAPGSKHGLLQLSSPLIGRDKEFEMMKSVLDKVMKAKSAVLSINGEAGVGKSRLIDEFKKITKDKVNWLSGRCPSYGKGFPFWVFLEQIRSYLGVRDSDLDLQSRRKVGGKAESLFKERTDEYLPYLCIFLSIKVLEHLQEKVKYLDPESLRLQEFVSVKVLFRDIAKNKPLILYFEDMHWIDPESLELLKFLLDGLQDESIFFLFETRPEKKTGLYKIKESIQNIFKKRYNEISLRALDTNDAKRLIQNLLKIPEPPGELSSLVLEKSEGNPFYIEEIVRSFIESGVLKRDSGSWRVAKSISSFEVPDTVEAVIRSRIDQLPPEVQEVLGRASVIGKNFLCRILSSISKKDNLSKNLGFLEERGFIQRKTNSFTAAQFSQDAEYGFKHILIKDVAYTGLSKKKKCEIHKKVAECVERIFREKIEDYYEVIAYHYFNAEILEKSYEYYKKAGDRAKKLYSNNVAIGCYAKAIEIHKKLFPEDEQESMAELFEKMGDVEEIKAEYDNAIKNYKVAFGYYRDIEKMAGIKRKTGHIFRQKGKYDSAFSNYEEAIRMLKNIPDSPVLSETLINYAFVLADGRNDYEKAQEMIERTLKKLDKIGENKIYARGLTTLGNIFLLKGDYEKILKHHEKALEIYGELNDKKGIVVTSNNIGNVYHDKGELDTALRHYKRGLATSKGIGYKSGIGAVSGNIGVVYGKKGEFAPALKYCKIYLSISEEIGDKMGVGRASGKIGTIYFDRGDLDTALKYFKKYLTIAEEMGDKLGVSIVSGDIGSVYHDKGKFDRTLNYYKKSLAVAKGIGYKGGIGAAFCNIGIVYCSKGELNTSRKYLEKSKKILTKIGDKINLSSVYASLSDLDTVREEYETALTFSEKALSLAKETGAREKEVIALRVFGKALFEVSRKQIEDSRRKREEKGCKMYDVRCRLKDREQRKKTIPSQNLKKAISYLRQSIALAKKQKMQLEIAKSSYELARILADAGKIKEAKREINSAKKIFKKSCAHSWLKKVKEIENM